MSDKNFKIKNGIDANGASSIASSSVSDTTLSINSISGQYGLIQAWNVVGSTVVQVDGNGHFYTLNGRGVFVNSGWIASTRFAVTPWQTSSIGMIIKGLPSQTGDLTQWQNSDGTVLAKIDSSGSITAADLTLSGNLTVNGTTTNLNSTNLIIEDKNIIIADVATPTDTTADGAGITVKGATDKTFNWVQSTKSFTTSDPLIINNTSTTTVPLIAKGYASQTANHFEVQDSAGNKMFVVNPPAGTLQPLEYFFVRPGGTGGTATIGTNSYSFRVVAAGGNSVSFGTSGGGTSLQVVTSDTFNRYKIIGSGTGIAPTFTTDGNDANVNMYVTAKGAGKIGINTTSPTGYVHAVSSSSSTVGLIVEGATGQTSTNIFEVQRAGGGDPSFTVSHNYINLNRNTTAAASLTVYGANSGAVPLYVIGRSSQSVDLQQWQNSAGTVIAKVDNLGVISSSFGLNIGSASFSGVAWNGISNPSSVTTLPTLVIKGIASQTAKLQEWQNNSGTTLASVNNNGVFETSASIFTPYLQPLNGGGSYLSLTQGNPVTANTLSASVVPFAVKGAASQTANLQEWQNSGGTAIASVDASGNIYTSSTTIWAGYNRAANGAALYNFTTVAGATYAQAAITRESGFNGNLVIGQQGTGAVLVQNGSASAIGLIVKGTASQTANLQEWQDSAGNLLSAIRSDGVLRVSQIISKENYSSYFTFSSGSPIQVNPLTSGTVGLVVKAVASQTSDLQQWQNSGGTTIALINSSGDFVARNIYASASAGYYTAQVNILPDSAAKAGIVIRGVASQTANLQEWQNSSGTVLAKVDSSGSITSNISFAVNNTSGNAIFSVSPYSEVSIPGVIYAGLYATAKLNLLTNNTSMIGAIIRGQTSQTADLQQWQDSAGTVLARVYNNGVLSAGSLYAAAGDVSVAYGGYFGGGTAGGYIGAAVSVIPWTTAVVGVIVRGRASQTANLQEWQNSSGTMLSKIDKDGIITVPAINVVGQSISSNTTMIAGYRYFVDTSASRTLTLPSSATIGDEIQIFDSTNTAGTNNITINSNNGKIEGVVESYIIDVNGAAIVMTYTGSTYGWKVRM